jgi:hypothetical protein
MYPKRLALYFGLLVMIGCRVMLIGAYDEVTDQAIQKIQDDVSSLIIQIEKNAKAGDNTANKYENFKASYSNIQGQLESVLIRCNALPKYQPVVEQLTPFDSTIKRMETFHSKFGFTTNDTASIRIIRETLQFDFRQLIILQNALKRKTNKE